MNIIVIGDPQTMVAFVEELAQDHGGVKEMRGSFLQFRTECEDGSVISIRKESMLRGYRCDEVWLSSEPDPDTFNDYILPMVHGDFTHIRRCAEKGYYNGRKA